MRSVGSFIGAGMAIALCSQAVPAAAQETAKKEQRRPGFTPQIVSPEVQPDRRVTFRLRAPEAKQVTVSGEWGGGARTMTRDEGGTWTVTVGPLEPEIYGYSFNVDGFQTLDPGNRAV